MLEREFEHYRIELGNRTNDVTLLTEQLSNITKEAHLIQAHLKQADSDREDATAQFMRISSNLSQTVSERDKLLKEVSSLEKQASSEESTISGLRKQLKELETKTEEIKVSYMRRTKIAEDQVRKFHSQLHQKSEELDLKDNENRKLQREYQATRQDAEGMLIVLQGLERQISEYACREIEFERRAKDNKEVVENALTVRNQAQAQEEHSRRELELLLLDRKKERVSKQGDIDKAIELTKDKFNSQLKSLENELHLVTISNAKFKSEAEVALRDMRTLKESCERVQRLREDERKNNIGQIKMVEEKLSVAIQAKEEEHRRKLELQEINKDLRSQLDRLRAYIESAHVKAESKEKSKDAELISLRVSLKNSLRDCGDKSRTLIRKLKEFEEEKNSLENQLSAAEQRRVVEANMLQMKVTDLENRISECDQSKQNEDLGAKILIKQIKEKTSAAVSYLESRLSEERNIVADINERHR